jgi:hypothetical protein
VHSTHELSAVELEEMNLDAAADGCPRSAQCPAGFKRIADGRYTASEGCTQQRPQHAWKHVRVLVGVYMRDGDAGRLQAADLGYGLTLDVRRTHAAANEVASKGGEGGTKAFCCGERRDLRPVERGCAIHQDDMATYAQRWLDEGGVDGGAECGAGRHQRCGGEHAGCMEFQNGAVDAQGEAEIIGIDDETPLLSYSFQRVGHGRRIAGEACTRRLLKKSIWLPAPRLNQLLWHTDSIPSRFQRLKKRSQIHIEIFIGEEGYGILISLQIPSIMLNADRVNVNSHNPMARVSPANPEKLIASVWSEDRNFSPIMNQDFFNDPLAALTRR